MVHREMCGMYTATEATAEVRAELLTDDTVRLFGGGGGGGRSGH